MRLEGQLEEEEYPFLVPPLKREMKEMHWESVKNIQTHVTTFLKGIPVEEFQDTCFHTSLSSLEES